MWSAIFNRFSLRTVLVLYILVPLLFAMAAISYLGLRGMENILEQRMQEDVQLVARAIRLPVSYSLEKERYGSVSQALQSVFHIERVYGAYVYDIQGQRIAAVGAVEPDRQEFDVLQKVESGEREGRYEKIQGRRVYSYFVPLFDTSEKSIGLLQVIRRKSDFESSIYWLRYGMAASIFVTGLCLSGLVLFGFHKALGRYFIRLAQSMSRVESGDHSHRARPEGPKEIASLAKSLNSLLDSRDRSAKEIAERRDAQQVLESKLRQNEKMAAVGRLAAGVAHELGAPLSLIDGKAQRCLRKSDLSTNLAESFQDIRRQVQRMSDIIRQLLDFGKGSMQQRRWTNAAYLAESAVKTVWKETEGRVECFAEGPEPGPSLYVDPLRIEQALVNLLRNAVQFETSTRVRLTWEQAANQEVVFRVEDDGPGIAPDIQPRLFEPFFSTRKNAQNTGMGLPVVHGIVQEHGGTIQIIDSELGGAGFRISLPVQTGKNQIEQGEEHV